MSLEAEVAQFSTAASELMDKFTQELGDHIEDTTLLEVGSGKEFATIKEAWDSLRDKVISAEVRIKVDDGVYTAPEMVLSAQPYAHRVIIEGNIANPAACILEPEISANGLKHCITFVNARFVEFSGFTIRNADVRGSRGLSISSFSRVASAKGSLVFNNCDTAVRILVSSVAVMEGIQIDNCRLGVIAGESSYGVFNEVVMNGRGWSTTQPLSERNYGLLCQYGAYLLAQKAVINHSYYGGLAHTNGSVLYLRGTFIDNCRHGFMAQWAGQVDAQPKPTFDANGNLVASSEPSRAENCEQGFYTHSGGTMLCQQAVANNNQRGFLAEMNSFMRAESAIATNNALSGYEALTNSTIVAYGSQANVSGNGVDYALANSVQGSSGGWIHYS